LNFQSKDQPSLWWVTLRVGLVYPGRIPSATSACAFRERSPRRYARLVRRPWLGS
jgi:hypothetical protein